MSEKLTIEANDYLVKEGDDSNLMYILDSGTLAVFKDFDGEERQVGTVYAGELVGEMSFIDSEPRSASVKAISDCELRIIPPGKFEAYLNEQPRWFKVLISTLISRLRKTNTKVRI